MRYRMVIRKPAISELFSVGDFSKGGINMAIVGIGINIHVSVNLDAVTNISAVVIGPCTCIYRRHCTCETVLTFGM